MFCDGFLSTYLNTNGQHSISRADSKLDLNLNSIEEDMLLEHCALSYWATSTFFFYYVYSVQIIMNMFFLFWEKVDF